ncbi:MAG: hypothetical protein Q8934_22995 [Bacillota bacterium]|nr:hypothetical protein [Bacillota bacterium]
MERPTEEEYKIAESNGISRQTVYQRIKYGWSKKKAITKPVTNYRKLCKEIGINYDTFNQRLERGWKVEKALNHPVNVKNRPKNKVV